MKYFYRIIFAFLISLAIHFVALFFIHQDVLKHAEFGVSTGGGKSTEVSLVAHAPTEQENKIEKESPRESSPLHQKINPEDVTQPSIKKIKNRKKESSTENSKSQAEEATQDLKEKGQGTGPGEGGHTLGSTDAKPDYLKNPAPEYPEESRENHEEGIVVLFVEVSETGNPLTVSLQKSSGFRRLDESAIKSVKRWKFKPASKNKIPIRSRVEVPVKFRLNQ